MGSVCLAFEYLLLVIAMKTNSARGMGVLCNGIKVSDVILNIILCLYNINLHNLTVSYLSTKLKSSLVSELQQESRIGQAYHKLNILIPQSFLHQSFHNMRLGIL